jgi:predicted dehydrogenase
MNVAIIGAGLIGKKRASSLEKNDFLSIVCDINEVFAKELAHEFSTNCTGNVKDIINNRNIDTVIVSVINKFAAQITTDMLLSGKNVLCEKPLGQNVEESQVILSAAEKNNKIVKTGFNHRFHPSMIKTKSIIESGQIGDIINIRCTYGHGGRPGMEKEWRCSKDLSGGGELIDQGVHLIDLCRWFTDKDVDQVYGKTYRSFWESNVEDNAFFHLEFDGNILAQCHVSWTNWKNIFSFEIFGKDGYIKIDGLGGSYGKETLEVGYRQPNGGIPASEHFDFADEDNSWVLEWKEFKQSIEENRDPIGSGKDGYAANVIIDAIYKSNDLNKPVSVN